MAITQTSLGFASGTKQFVDTDNAGTAVAVSASACTLYYIQCDNSANGAISYVCLWDVASGSVTVGTTAPSMIIYVPASAVVTIPIPAGIAFGTALTVASKTAGGTAGSTGPTSDLIVRIVYA